MELNLKKFVPALLASASALVFFSVAASAGPCPALGNIPAGCNETITLNAGGTGTVVMNNITPYDGSDDQLVGVINNTGASVTQITLSGSSIGAFDNDGGWAPASGCVTIGPNTFGCFTPSIAGNPGDYSGPNNIFNPFSANTVVDTFVGGLANGATTFFTLETAPTAALTVVVTNAPEPASLAILGAALAGFGFVRRRRKI